ncbi:MAG TPA: alpha/beta fold hydrolase [Anaerolineae bacterium]|nr:alpha/beta fold hydrolase [Anaerolineae bacterium]
MPYTPNYFVPPERHPYDLIATIDNTPSPVACLMLHGFMGSPYSSRPMAQFLSAHGISMHAPLLPGHGNYPEKLHKIDRQQWFHAAEEAFHHLKNKYQHLFIIGHSMGTVLAAHLITTFGHIDGLIMLTPLYAMPDKRLRYIITLRHIMPWFYPYYFKSLRPLVKQRVLDFDPTVDFDDPAIQKWLPRGTRIPTTAFYQMSQMIQHGRTLWPQLHLPILLFQGGHDPAVSPASMQQLFASIPSSDKHLQKFPQAGHELMRPFEPAHAQVWRHIHHFIDQRTPITLPQLPH